MRIRCGILFLLGGLALQWPAWAGFKFGLGGAAAAQGSAAIETAETEAAATRLPACTEIPYTVSPLALSDNFNIEALGHLAPYPHTFPTEHVYFIIIKSTNDTTAHNVYAPADLAITRLVLSETLNNVGPHIFDYSYYFSVCSGMDGYFHHVKFLSPELTAAVGPINSNCQTYSDGSVRTCSVDTFIRISAGDIIGTTVGSLGSSLVGLDFGTHDLRTAPLAFANPSRRATRQLHTVCPVDYYGGSLQTSLRSRLGSFDGVHRTVEPICGEYNQDIAERAQGNWYVEGTPPGLVNLENAELALVHDNVDPTKGVFSVGQSVTASGLDVGPYRFTPASSGFVNRDFDGVTPGNVYCYDSQSLIGAVILIDMPTSTSLRIEKKISGGCGLGPWALTSNATTFIR